MLKKGAGCGIVLMLVLALAGCNDSFQEKVNQVRGFVQGKCGFIPTIASVTDVLLQAGGAATAVGAMGKQLCEVLTAARAAPKVQGLMSSGEAVQECKAWLKDVCIEGEWDQGDGR